MTTLKTTLISNREASPIVNTPVRLSGARKRSIIGTLETLTSHDTADIYVICPVESHWAITSIKVYQDALTAMAADVGIYTAASTPVVVDVDAYASAVDFSGASLVGLEVAFEARDVANLGQQVWQDVATAASLTVDSQTTYYLCLTLTGDISTAGTMSFKIEYLDS